MTTATHNQSFVHWFRQSSPYIHAFRGKTFVLTFDGAAVASPLFAGLIHDIALLNALGIRLIIVHGARPQIEKSLQQAGHQFKYVDGLRITDDTALLCVKQAVGTVRVEIEAQLSMGLPNSPMAGAKVQVISGNFVTAQPLGIRNGIDFHHTGEVRRIDNMAIKQCLDSGAVVLASPLGYSPTGEIFNLTANEVATAIAVEMNADKLLFLTEAEGIHNAADELVRELTTQQAKSLLKQQQTSADELQYLRHAINASRQGVKRTHLIDRRVDGGLLQELFSRDGIGTLITSTQYENTHQASIDDVGGIIELIKPMEADGILVRRSREQLELEINHFSVIERDGTIVACAALYPDSKGQLAELACLAVHPDYRKANRGGELLSFIEKQAQQQGIKQIFVLTTMSSHWFKERGFVEKEIDSLPIERQAFYNFQRNSKVFVKNIRT